MIRRILRYSLVIVVGVVVGYGGLTVFEEVTQTEAARVSASVQLAEKQAENVNRALGSVSVFADGSPDGDNSQADSQPALSEINDIDTLISRWEPLYEDAKLAYVKFGAAIDNAKTSASRLLRGSAGAYGVDQ